MGGRLRYIAVARVVRPLNTTERGRTGKKWMVREKGKYREVRHLLQQGEATIRNCAKTYKRENIQRTRCLA